jgi:hypothetical protein
MPTKLFIVCSVIVLLSGCALRHKQYVIPADKTEDMVEADYESCRDNNPYKHNILYAIESEAFQKECMRDKGYKLAGIQDR